MSYSITRTKVIRPRRAQDLLSRPRLLGLLDDLLEYRLALIAAPAGYGKTTLLVDFADQAAYPVCWLSLDPLDSDPLRFISYLIAAIQEVFPTFGGRSRSLISNLSGPEIDQEQVLHTIINDLYENIEEHFALVLDDFHLVEYDPVVSGFINRFSQEVDENCHLVIASRSLLSLPDLPLMIGRSQVKGLSFEELAFHPDEIRELYRIKYQQEMSSQEAEAAAEKTEGWITGLLLTAETTREGPTDHDRAAKTAGIDLYDYLAGQVLEQQTAEMQGFLLRSSLLEEFDAALCRQALGPPPGEKSWEELIQQLLRKNLFIQPVDSGGTWLRYHHLFGKFLRQYYLEHDPQEARTLLKDLVAVFSKKGRWEKAYAICQQLDDNHLIGDLLESACSPLLHKGKISLLETWLNDLDQMILDDRPTLVAYFAAISSMRGDSKTGLLMLNNCLDNHLYGEDKGIQALLLIRRAHCLRIQGSYQEGLEDASKALELAKAVQEKRIFEAESQREIGLNLVRLGKIQNSITHLNEALKLYLDQKDHNNAAIVEMDLGLLAMNKGSYQEARDYFQGAYQLWETLGNFNRLIGICNNLGVLDHLSGEYMEAHKWFAQALEFSRQTGSSRNKAFTLASLTDLALDLGALSYAENYLDEASRLAVKSGETFLQGYLRVTRAVLARKDDRLEGAKTHLDATLPFVRENPFGVESGKLHYEWGLIWLEDGQLELARSEFSAAGEIFSRSKTPVENAAALILQARVEDLLGNKAAVNQQLEQAGEILHALGTHSPLVTHLFDLEGDLEALAKGFPPDHFLYPLLRAVRDFQSQLPVLQAALGWDQLPVQADLETPLEISVLGRELVLRQGEPIVAPEWTKQKTVRELFFYLLSQPEGATREEICLVFWPNSSQKQLAKQFKNALYRLRRAVGKEVILFHQPTRLYHFNRNLKYHYDVDDFQSSLLAAENESDPDKKVHHLLQAVKSYRHPYAPSLEGIWAEPMRYRLYLAYEEALLELARLQESRGDTIGALKNCQKLLTISPGQEAASRIAMRAHAARGDRAGIERIFQACRLDLDRELDTEPSPKTLALYEKLMG
jgi:LuxR family maltose regulon positive regulatory protein